MFVCVLRDAFWGVAWHILVWTRFDNISASMFVVTTSRWGWAPVLTKTEIVATRHGHTDLRFNRIRKIRADPDKSSGLFRIQISSVHPVIFQSDLVETLWISPDQPGIFASRYSGFLHGFQHGQIPYRICTICYSRKTAQEITWPRERLRRNRVTWFFCADFYIFRNNK